MKNLEHIIDKTKFDCKSCNGYKETCKDYWVRTAYTTLCEYRILEIGKKEYKNGYKR